MSTDCRRQSKLRPSTLLLPQLNFKNAGSWVGLCTW
jgi:hypothetical protein